MHTKDRWLQWELLLNKEHNRIDITLHENTKSKDDKWATAIVVGSDHLQIRFWMMEVDVCRKLNKIQEKLLKRYAANYKRWYSLETGVLKNFTGGKIVLSDDKTTYLINKFI